MTYQGSMLQGTADAVAREMKCSILLEMSDAWQNSVESGIVWIQPEEGRYRYDPPRYQPAVNNSILDRYVVIDVIVRAPGSQRAQLELSDRFLAAMDTVLGPPLHDWKIDRDSSGGGAAPDESVWIEVLRVLIRYDVIRDKFSAGGSLQVITSNASSGGQGTVDSGMFVEGPAIDENTETVI